MKYYKTLLLSIFVFFSSNAFATERSWFDEPIKINKTYVTDAEAVILESLKQRGWEVKEKSATMVTAWLNDYKGYELVLEIKHDNAQISFKQLSYKKVGCESKSSSRCKASTKYSNKWRLYLRKNIAMNIHKRAMDHLLKNEKIRRTWLEELKTGNIEFKTKLARNLIDIEYFNEYALAEIVEQINANYQRNKLSSDEVQQYAFFCKVLARSKQEKHTELLTQVSQKAKSRKLRNYVKGYLTEMAES
ncbi:hypothetical protein CXF85_19995 [Colwellia sp. 75C3]|uniref:hypothetical protein n=1 Tax=Colwellia sp. 75C3 TaxID=888425 RepID=UPI000C32EC24|nr:hypothetical protein [Colwellia sp. 75C3]PKG81045.1 hypothetical protein CXF85_19995 [Colwellia sp. 75C3]